MAKTISLMGNTYQDVPAVVLPKSPSGTARFLERDEVVSAFSGTDVTKSTAKASVVSFSDADAGAMACTAEINPVQDLHGYGYPWYPGGGKNRFRTIPSDTKQGVTMTLNADGSVTFTGTNTGGALYFDVWEGTFDSTAFAGYILSLGSNASANCAVRISDSSRTNIQSCAADPVTIANNGSGLYLAFRIGNRYAFPDGGITLYPMIRASGTSDAFEPYGNECPVTGWTGANITVSPTLDAQDGTAYAVSFPTAAGTVYGGTLKVNRDGTGVLISTMRSVDLSSVTKWTYNNTSYSYGFFYTPTINSKAENQNFLCSAYRKIEGGRSQLTTDKTISTYNLSSLIQAFAIRDDAYTDPDEFGAAVAGVQVVFELATPVLYALTAPQIAALTGQNNVWADTGDTAVTYPADLADIIDSIGT